MTFGIAIFCVVGSMIAFVVGRVALHAFGYIKDPYSEDWWI